MESNQSMAPQAVIEESRELVDRLLDGRMTVAEKNRLEQLAVQHPQVAELYIGMVHLWCNLPLHLPHIALFDFSDSGQIDSVSMHESLVLPAIRESDTPSDEPLTFPGPVRIEQLAGRKGFPGSRWSQLAAVFLVGIIVFWAVHRGQRAPQISQVTAPVTQRPPSPAPRTFPAAVPAAIVTATANTGSADGSLLPGTKLEIGRPVQLTSGVIELKFASGAIATIAAPARFGILSDNSLTLEDGSLAAHVPESAHGFRVNGPGLSVVDRGTNFGVRSSSDRATSEVCIFTGIVDATGLNTAGEPTGTTVHAAAGQALSHHTTDTELTPTAYQPEHFIRQISDVNIPVLLQNTGDNLAPGAADPNWTVISVPNDPAWKAKSAMVIRDLSPMYDSSSNQAKWIGINDRMDNQPTGTFVFQTTVDLGDSDPATIQVSAAIAADDCVTDIKVNGVSTGASNSPDNPGPRFITTDVRLPAGPWRKGINYVQVEVLNRPNANAMNCMLLQIRWKATILARVHRANPAVP